MTAEPRRGAASWWLTVGAVLTFGLVVEAVSGLALSLYYAPTPDHAWDSIRYITTDVRFGAFVRALHYWGATIIISILALHLVRVVVSGGYRRPNQANWIVGVVLLQVVLAFGMTGYLLPWDQRAYWATVVRISIAKLTPVFGGFAANLMRGGPDLGAMTLLRWYAVHVMVLPAILAVLVVVHLRLRGRERRTGYFPEQAARDVIVAAGVALVLIVLARHGMPALEPQADPTSGDYIPRPEWYFAGLFQFVKMFPGKAEVVGALVIPGLAMAGLVLLPWIDRGRTSAWRDRKLALGLFGAGVVAVTWFTVAGAMDVVPRAGARWNVREVAGAQLIATGDRCARCHTADGIAAPIAVGHIGRPQDWLAGHVADPEMIAPGLRPSPSTDSPRDQQAILAALLRMRAGAPPDEPPADRQAAVLFNHWCLSCHAIGGVGGKEGPDLTHVGVKIDADAIARRVTDPTSVKPDAEMPAFGSRMTPAEIQTIAAWLARQK